MANKEVSELTQAGTLDGAEIFHLVQSGNSRKDSLANVLGLISQVSVISPSQITADQDDYAPSGLATAGVLRLTSDAERAVTGLTAGSANDPRKLIINVGSFPITLQSEDTNSTAANRFALDGPDELYIRPGGAVLLYYDTTSSRWRPVWWSNANTQIAHGSVTSSPEPELEPSNGDFQTLTNNVAFAWNAPTEEGFYIVLVTNGASAGAITAPNFDYEETSNFDTTNGNKFEVVVSNYGGWKAMTVKAQQ